MAYWFQRAWIDNQWQRDVRLTVAEGRLSALETGVDGAPEDERHGAAWPGL